MTGPTDKTIEILCSECEGEHYETGVQAMFEHILEAHPQYNQHEADVYALKWAEDAFDRFDRNTEAYHDNQKLVNSIRRQTGEF